MVIEILTIRALETNAVGKQCVHHEHHFNCESEVSGCREGSRV